MTNSKPDALTSNEQLAEEFLNSHRAWQNLEKLCVRDFAQWLDNRAAPETECDHPASTGVQAWKCDLCGQLHDHPPMALLDPVAVLERGRKLLEKHERITRSAMLEFLGWLSGDIPELHGVEVPRLADSWERYRAQLDAMPAEKANAEQPGHHCGKLKAECDDEFCPTHGRDIR